MGITNSEGKNLEAEIKAAVEAKSQLTEANIAKLNKKLASELGAIDVHPELNETIINQLKADVQKAENDMEVIEIKLNDANTMLPVLRTQVNSAKSTDQIASNNLKNISPSSLNRNKLHDAKDARYRAGVALTEASNDLAAKEGQIQTLTAELEAAKERLSSAVELLKSAENPSFQKNLSATIAKVNIDPDIAETERLSSDSTIIHEYRSNYELSSDHGESDELDEMTPVEKLEQTIKQAEQDLSDIEKRIAKEFEQAEITLNELRTVVKIKTEIFNLSGTAGTFYNTSKYNTALAAKNNATNRLAEAEIDLPKTQMLLLGIKNTIQNGLTSANNQLKAFNESKKLESVDIVGMYAAPERLDEVAPVVSRTIQSLYEQEKPQLQEKLDLKKDTKQSVERWIEDRNSVETKLDETNKKIEGIKSDQKTIKTALDSLHRSIATSNYSNRIKYHQKTIDALDTRWMFSNIIEPIYKFFGIQTGKDKAILERDSLQALKNDDDQQEVELQETTAMSQKSLKEETTSLYGLKEQQRDLNQKINQEDKPEQLGAQIEALEAKLNRNEDTVKSELLARCKLDGSMGILREREHPASVKVKTELKHFLTNPTDMSLSRLTRTINENPDYLNDKKLTFLLTDAKELFPEITFSLDKLIQILSTEKSDNIEKIDKLEDEKTLLQQELEQYEESLSEQSDMIENIETNKNALKENYMVLFMLKRFKIASPTEDKQATNAIFSIERNIQQIKNNLPDDEIHPFKMEEDPGAFQTFSNELIATWGGDLESLGLRFHALTTIVNNALTSEKNRDVLRGECICLISKVAENTTDLKASEAYVTFLDTVNSPDCSETEINNAFIALKSSINPLDDTVKQAIDKSLENEVLTQKMPWVEDPEIKVSNINEWVTRSEQAKTSIKNITTEVVALKQKNTQLDERKASAAQGNDKPVPTNNAFKPVLNSMQNTHRAPDPETDGPSHGSFQPK